MLDLDLALPFGAGMLATVNPCGFAMLPAYLAFFVSGDDGPASPAKAVPRALAVGATMTASFVAVFGIFGLFFAGIKDAFDRVLGERAFDQTVLPIFSMVTGALLLVLAIAMLFFGYSPNIGGPKLNKGGKTRSLGSMFVFGVSFAIASLGCTIGPFLGTVGLSTGGGSSDSSVFEQISAFLAYGVGMGVVVLALTVAAAVAQTSVATGLRKMLPYVNKISGAFLLIAGAYVMAYGWFEWRAFRGSVEKNWLDEQGQSIQGQWSNWFNTTGTGRLGWIFLLGISAAVFYALWKGLDRQKRSAGLGMLGGTYLVLEVVYGGGLLVLSLFNWVIEWPLRVFNWFSDPLRFGVPIEIGFLAFIGYLIYRKLTSNTDSPSYTSNPPSAGEEVEDFPISA